MTAGHCRFFSSRFHEILAKDRRGIAPGDHAAVAPTLVEVDATINDPAFAACVAALCANMR